MTTIYTGSNYGVISTLNSGTGTITAGSTYSLFTYELVKNYTCGALLIDFTSGIGLCTINLLFSSDNLGTITATQSFSLIKSPGKYTFDFKPQGQYLKVQIVNNSSSINISFNLQTKFNNSDNPNPDPGVVSPTNSFAYDSTASIPLFPINGSFEDIIDYSLITLLARGTSATIPASCIIDCIFSIDGVNEDRIVSYTVQDLNANGSSSNTNTLAFNPAHTLVPIARYFKIRIKSPAPPDPTPPTPILTSLYVSTIYHINKSKALTSRVTQKLTDQYDADTSRSIIVGRTLGTKLPQGSYQNIGVFNQSLSTYIREPTTAFGEVLTASLTPIIQYDFSNGFPLEVMAPIYFNSQAKTAYNYNNAKLSLSATNTTGGTTSIIESTSSEYTKYKAGQGIDMRLTAIFDPSGGAAGSSQYAGVFTPENSLTFGYFGSSPDPTNFSIRHCKFGVQQITTIDISGTSTAAGNFTINFGNEIGTGGSISTPLLPLIPSGSLAYIAASAICDAINSATVSPPSNPPELLNTYGWKANYYVTDIGGTGSNATVKIIYNYASSTQVTIGVTTSTTGYTTQINSLTAPWRAGISPSYAYYTQDVWDINTCKNMGSLQSNYDNNNTGFELDTSKGNIYRIVYQYLGYGAITFYIENPESGLFLPVHQIKYANSNLLPSVSSPNYKVGFGVENTGFNGTKTIAAASISAFIQGKFIVSQLYRSYPGIIAGNTFLGSISKINSRILFGFRVIKAKTTNNSTGSIPSKTITLNRSNLFLTSVSTSLNVRPPNQSTQIQASMIYQIVKNPTGFYTGNGTGTKFIPKWRISEFDSSIEVFDGELITSTSTGITYTGGLNVYDIALVENTAITSNLKDTLINVAYDDIYLISAYGSTFSSGAGTWDLLSTITYQVNN